MIHYSRVIRTSTISCLLLALALSSAQPLYFWSAAQSGNWEDPNWNATDACCPDADSRVLISAAPGYYEVRLNAPTTIYSLTIGSENNLIEETAPALVLQPAVGLQAYNFTLLAGSILELGENSTLHCIQQNGVFEVAGNASVGANLGVSVSGCDLQISAGFVINGNFIVNNSTRISMSAPYAEIYVQEAYFESNAEEFQCSGTINNQLGGVRLNGRLIANGCRLENFGFTDEFFLISGFIDVESSLTLDSAGYMRITATINIKQGASLIVDGSIPALGLRSFNTIVGDLNFAGPGSKLIGLENITQLGVEGNVSFTDGASCIYAGILALGAPSTLDFLTATLTLNRAKLTTISSGGFNAGITNIVNDSQVDLFGASYFRSIGYLNVENSRINASDATRFVVENWINMNATALFRNSSLELRSLARIDVIGTMSLDHSEAILRNGTILVHNGFTLCNQSTLRIAGINATLRLLNDGLNICNDSALIVESGASLDLSDSVVLLTVEDILLYIRSGGTQGGSPVLARNPNINIDGSSKLELRSGATILGVGTINGVVVNNGGVISYRKGGSSGFFIDTLQQSNTSTIQAGVSVNPLTQIPVLSTVLLLRNATLEGTIEFFVDPNLDAALQNSSAYQNSLKPGSGGLLLINVTQGDISSVPKVVLRSSSGAALDAETACHYALEKRGRALYLVFDVNRPCSGSPGSPTNGAAESASVAIAAIVVPIVVIVVVAAIILAFILSPTLRIKVFRWEAAQAALARQNRPASAEYKPETSNQWRRATAQTDS